MAEARGFMPRLIIWRKRFVRSGASLPAVKISVGESQNGKNSDILIVK